MAKYIYPVAKKITQAFGADPAWYKANVGQNGHNGIDLGVPYGTPVKAIADGTVAFEGWGQLHGWMGAPAGICVLIKHAILYSGYAHLSRTIVNNGQKVKQGQVIGYSGATGVASGPHVHFEMLSLYPDWYNGYAGRINPAPFLDEPEPTYYTVRKGDTLSSIAVKYKTTVAKLVSWNKGKYKSLAKNPNLISIGWKLRVK